MKKVIVNPCDRCVSVESVAKASKALPRILRKRTDPHRYSTETNVRRGSPRRKDAQWLKRNRSPVATRSNSSAPRARRPRSGRTFFADLADGITIAGQRVEIEIASVSAVTARITVRPIQNGRPVPVPVTGELVEQSPGRAVAHGMQTAPLKRVRAGDLVVKFHEGPPTIVVETAVGSLVQRLTFDTVAPDMSFLLPTGPLLGLGEGGPQFDRKGSADKMIIGQGGYHLATFGTRAPVQWLVGTDGWAMFIHQPYGQFDFTGAEGKFTPSAATALPLQLFVVASLDPKVIMREYARLTGFAELPALWTLGYQQSHRTLAGADEVMGIARTMREKKLPCDTLIYLGTEFTPSGWNTRNGEFTWHPTNFPDPRGDARRTARRAFQGRAAHRSRGTQTHRHRKRSLHRRAVAERAHAGQQMAARPAGVLLLAVSQTIDGHRR